MLPIENATKLADIMELAGAYYRGLRQSFADCVVIAFWKSFGEHEQSQLMQETYSLLCDMGFVPVESHK